MRVLYAYAGWTYLVGMYAMRGDTAVKLIADMIHSDSSAYGINTYGDVHTYATWYDDDVRNEAARCARERNYITRTLRFSKSLGVKARFYASCNGAVRKYRVLRLISVSSGVSWLD